MSKYPFVISGFCIFIFTLSGCKDAKINPFEEDTGTYSVYGAVNLHETEHVIRVRDLSVFHQDSNSINLDATVTFFDPEQGTSQVLRDSIVQFPENYTHNFLLNKEFMPRSPYRIVVERSDGESVSSIFTTPGITETEIIPISEGVSCYTEIDIVFKNVLPTEQIRWHIGFRYQNKMYWLELSRRCNEVFYPERNEVVVTETTRGFLHAFFPPPMSNAGCGGLFPEVSCADLDVQKVFLRYLHLGPEWSRVYPVRPTDPPDVGDVENGMGFLGAFREDTLSYTVFPD